MYLGIYDLKQGAYEEDLEVLQRYESNAERAIADAMGEVKNYLFNRYDIDKEYEKTGDDRSGYLVKIIRDISIYNIYCISAPGEMPEIIRLRYEDALKYLQNVSQQKNHIAGLDKLDKPTTGGSYGIAGGGNTPRNNQY